MRRFFRDNGLTIVLTALFLIFWAGQSLAGYREHNNEQREHGQAEIGFSSYLRSAHFWEATSENWESEFLQMFGYVILTAILFQRGSAESKDPEKRDPVDQHPREGEPEAPWPVRKGGVALKLYENSLSLAFLLFFLISIATHAATGAAAYNQEQTEHGEPGKLSALQYAGTAHFWFESLQNWQSEFLAIGSMVVLSIFLRQRGSPESKPVASPHSKTGE